MAQGVKTGGRRKGTPNKLTAPLKEAIIRAAERAGGAAGMARSISKLKPPQTRGHLWPSWAKFFRLRWRAIKKTP